MIDKPRANEPDRAGRTPDELSAPADAVRAVGAELARLRTQRGWSVEDVSVRLKVSAAKLRALEAGDLTHLPDLTFAVGVVRSYAKALGVDPQPLGDALRRATTRADQGLRLPAARGADLPRGQIRQMNLNGQRARRPWFWAVAAALLGLVALTMYHTDRTPGEWLAKLTSQAKPGAPASGAQVPAGSDSIASIPAAAPAQTAATGGLPASVPAAASAVGGVPPAGAGPAAGASTAAAVPVVAAPAASAAMPGQTAVLHLDFKQDSWVAVHQGDGKEVFSGTVHGGAPLDIQAVAPLKIVIGNSAGLAALQLDGKPVDQARLGNVRGNVARFTLP